MAPHPDPPGRIGMRAVDDHPVPEPECLTCRPAGAPPLEPGRQARTG
jgi:hypothetical protein